MFEIDTVLEGRYRLRSEGIAQDLGTIYRAYDLMAERLVDVLVLPEMAGLDADVLAHVRQSQQALAALGEVNLVPYEYAGWVGGRCYLVRGHMEDLTLAELLSRHGRLGVERAIEITIRLCQALAPVHRAGLVHGGLSPYCIFVREPAGGGPGARVAIADVGLLPVLHPALAARGRPWGRYPYLSPEQAAGEAAHPSSDVYVVGSLLYTMLTGRPPFRTADDTVLALQHLRQEPPALQILVPDVPVPLAQIVHSALSKEPAARYRNAGQLAHILVSQLPARRGPEAAAPVEPPVVAPIRARPASPAHLVVPPPPPRPIQRAYEFVEDERWDPEETGVDWLMIGLMVAATIAVLGLIPLWRTLYQRYAGPPPLPATEQGSGPAPAEHLLWLEAGHLAWEEWSACKAKLPAGAFFWYNSKLAGRSPNGARSQRYPLFWESSLRVFTEDECIIVIRQQVVEA